MARHSAIANGHAQDGFDHLEIAALRAIAARRRAESRAALALPPFNPPNLPSATAAGFLEAFWASP